VGSARRTLPNRLVAQAVGLLGARALVVDCGSVGPAVGRRRLHVPERERGAADGEGRGQWGSWGGLLLRPAST
jgi:hypothetical protein